jgi:GT2 family glycosyltransferase
MTIGVCVGTFGDLDRWGPLARRALDSVSRQTLPAFDAHHVHGRTLAEARNAAAALSGADHLVFLDADDELDPGYLAAMTEVLGDRTSPVLIQPSTLGVYPDGREDAYAVLIPERPLLDSNYLIIGTMIKRSQFLDLGGFEEWEMYEDWDLWIRAVHAGAEILKAPEAIYRVHVNEASRNNANRHRQVAVYGAIRNRHLRRA